MPLNESQSALTEIVRNSVQQPQFAAYTANDKSTTEKSEPQNSLRLAFFVYSVVCELIVLSRNDIHTASLLIKHHFTIAQCEQRVVATSANVSPGMPFGTALTSKNIARTNSFTAKFLDTATLSVRIASIAAGTLSLLMSHG